MKKIMLLTVGALLVLNPGLSLAQQQPAVMDTIHATVGSLVPAGSVTRAIDIIDRSMIERLPTHNIADAIARALGADVQQRSPAQSDLALRGSTTEQVLVLIDGVPANDRQTGHFHLDQTIPLDDVERIEVMRGAASSLYGTNAVGGIVNIVTRRGTQETLLRAEGGTFKTAEFSGTAGTMLRDVAPFTFSVEHDLSDGHRKGTDYRTTIAHSSLGIPAGGGMIRLDAGDAHRNFGASQFYAPFPTSYEKTKVVDAGAAYDRAYGEWSIEPRATIRKHYDDFVLKRENPAFYHNVHSTTDAGASMLVRGVIGDIRTALGGEAYHSWIKSTNLKKHSEVRNAEYGEAVAAIGMLTATGGLRADHHSKFGNFLSPSVGAAAHINDRVLLRASAARGFRAPTWTDRYYSDPANIGDSTLKVERAWTYEAGAAISPAAHWRADVSGYVRRVSNAIDWVRPAGASTSVPFHIVNIQRATFRGVEAMVQRTAFYGTDWTLRATALSFDADSAAGLSSKYALRPLTETASMEVGVPLPFGVKLGAIGSHQRRPGDKAYNLVDAQLGYRWRDLEAFLTGTNLTDEHYLDVSAVRAAGRAIQMGVRWRISAH